MFCDPLSPLSPPHSLPHSLLQVAKYLTFGQSVDQERLSLLSVDPLTALSAASVADAKSHRHGFIVTSPSEQRLFVAPSQRDKQAWILALRRAVADFSGETIEGGDDAAGVEVELTDDAGDEQDWLFDAPEDLDVFIAQRAFEPAVDLVERARDELKAHPPSQARGELEAALDRRVQQLTVTLCTELGRPALRRLAIRSIVRLLLRLGEREQACSMYLLNRTQATRREFRKLKMEGSTELYSYKLARMFFTALRTTCLEFADLFEPEARSAYVRWAQEELGQFAFVFSRQVLQSSTTSFSTVSQSVDVALTHCRSVRGGGLSEAGQAGQARVQCNAVREQQL